MSSQRPASAPSAPASVAPASAPGAPRRELRLPAPLEHQQPVLHAPQRHILWRAGRRTGKSRAEFIAAVVGRGRHDGNGVRESAASSPVWKGMLQGAHGVWLAPDYPQSLAIWREEVKPRFAGLAGAAINESQRRVDIPGLGSLEIRSAEAIDGVRGRRLDFAIFDEAAFFDAEYAWTAVIRPALADRRGWSFWGSTTNAGHDGNSAKRVPSYFNLLCERAERGELGPDWVVFHNSTRDNPKLDPAEVAALYAEYPPGSATAAQELDAELGVLGGRFYTLNADVHLLDPARLPRDDQGREMLPEWWEYWGAFDWGYAHWAVFGLYARDGEGTIYLVDSTWVRRQQDAELARAVVALCEEHRIDARTLDIYAGHDCWAKVTARAAPGITTADVFLEHGLSLLKADIDRVNGGRAVRRALAVREEGDGGRSALFRIVDRAPRPGETVSGNRRCYNQLVDAQPDPNDVNKPLKVDADADGLGGDDGADMVRYGLATRVLAPQAPVPVVVVPDTLRDTTELVVVLEGIAGDGDAFGGLPAGF